MPSYAKFVVAALAVAVSLTSAQTYTNCNPLHKTCPPDPGLKQTEFISDFTKGDSALKAWNTTSGHVSTIDQGAEFTIKKKGDAPTLQSNFNILFGVFEVKMKAAPGTGIVSTIVAQSDDKDEIDWEALGGDKTQIQSNYFGKGNSSTYDRAKYHNVQSPQDKTHTYTVTWTPESIVWSIDGKVVRTLEYDDAINGKNFPQTPVRMRIGIWPGGDPTENNKGTVEWAGGVTDYSGTPYTMYVESVKVTNYNPAASYKWTDNSGSYESIKSDNSTHVDGTTSSSESGSDSDSGGGSASSSSGSSSVSSGSGSGPTVLGDSGLPSPSVLPSGATGLGGPFAGPCALLALVVGLFC